MNTTLIVKSMHPLIAIAYMSAKRPTEKNDASLIKKALFKTIVFGE